MKKIAGLYSAPRQHWVGDGFPVRSLFSYDSMGRHVSPFLLLDYAGPANFEPSDTPRGVGRHPHRGFETVTIVYDGEVAHQDSTGAGGVIGPGDVQWMTAGAGIIHEEFHSPDFTRRGGPLEMVQLWVNLPARDKRAAPGYQHLAKTDIPVVELADGAGHLRVIAGEYAGHSGPARTFTPINVWDLKLRAGADLELTVPEGHTLALVVLHGLIHANVSQPVREAQMALYHREGSSFSIAAEADATVLLLAGEPIDEPIAGYGPFVMNTKDEIREAIDDFRSSESRFLAVR
ncbi:pirin family protein [Methyloversatilis discipulorum]|uniref:pirin family protein n=1 Tax=Methyloversatilis discipulorum TaxID=1119528 RepID=UPI001A56568D|nr:pirin family protein [Methyloversatilis discipulorum]MBL8470021.1 pirin family protein [Methyloversatilis discipulorum]